MSAAPVELLLGRLECVRQHAPDRWTARCPSHADSDPSLSVRITSDNVLLHCFAGCDASDVLAAVGMSFADLYPDLLKVPKRPRRPSLKPRFATHPPDPGASAYARSLWSAVDTADRAVKSHPYAVAKGIATAGGAGRGIASGKVIGRDADCVVVPIRTLDGELVAVECIAVEGKKQSFGPKSLGFLILGNDLDPSIPWAVVEGWADGWTWVFRHHQGHACAVVTFGKARLDAVAAQVAEHYTPDRLAIVREVVHD